MNERVCAVIVAYNRRALLRACLTALQTQTRPPDEILVVDNASTDGTRSMLWEEFPRVPVLALVINLGGGWRVPPWHEVGLSAGLRLDLADGR